MFVYTIYDTSLQPSSSVKGRMCGLLPNDLVTLTRL